MYISKFQILNYKGYRDSNEIEFKPGFNVITGQNSAGKTALLEALTLQFNGSPHRSTLTVPFPGAPHSQQSSVRITFVLSREELLQLLANRDSFIPWPRPDFAVPSVGILSRNGPGAAAFLAWLMRCPGFSVAVRFDKSANGGEAWRVEGARLGLYQAEPDGPGTGNVAGVIVYFDNNGSPTIRAAVTEASRSGALDLFVASSLRTRIYRFRAERFSVGECTFGNNPMLAPNAQNLPEVVNVLKANTPRFLHLMELVREVLPQVRHISVRALPGSQVQIIVWPHDPATEREDLAVPLNECGSGVGQVLAVLYVVMTSQHPQTIIVDELQSFLHPGAVRKLIDVLKQYPQHQYIFATHSPAVISAVEPATLTIARATAAETSLQPIDPGDAKHLQAYLLEIGARLADVFGADNILWVEGQTEELCFPRLLKAAGRSLMGTAVVGIRQTGDLQGRDKKKVLDLYLRLSEANTLLPPAIAFVFDQECLTEQQKDDLRRMRRGQVHFLPRRMYENYLLNAGAIAAVANAVEGFRATQVGAEEVQNLLEAKRGNRQYFCGTPETISTDWIRCINGAKALEDVFSELSENRVSYDKMTHSVAITEWLLEHHPDEFRELADFLISVLEHHAA